MLQRKFLTLCMITKNDEQYLLNSIENIKDIVDEIIIADIGSTDHTIDIAKQAGLEVYEIEWENDYSKVKNFCLDHANGRWVLFLQANEIILIEQKEKVLKLLDNPNVEGYLFYINYNSQVYGIFSPVQTLRLLRNRKEYRYKYKSFEMIPDKLLTNIKDVDIHIISRDDAALSWQFTSRLELLNSEITEKPQDCYLQYMIGIVLLNQSKFEECMIYLQNSRDSLNTEYLFAPHLYKCLSFCLLYLEKYTECLEVLNDGIDKFPLYRDLFVLRGELFNQLKQYKKSIDDFEHCLKMRERVNYIVPGPDISITDILESTGEVYERVFSYKKALSCYQELHELDSTNDDVNYKIAKLMEKTCLKNINFDDVQEVQHQFDNIMICKETMNRLNCWINNLNVKEAAINKFNELVKKSDEYLLEFYRNLCMTDSIDNDINKVYEIHEKIGDYYKKKNKKVEMLSAFLRVLQWEPTNKKAQNIIVSFFNENQDLADNYLEQEEWILEGNYFKNKNEFKNYIYGIINLKNQQFNQALLYFNKISQSSYAYPIVFACICGSLWLNGKEEDITMDKNNITKDFIKIFYNICKEYIIDRLDENIKKYPHNELIKLEKERISNECY